MPGVTVRVVVVRRRSEAQDTKGIVLSTTRSHISVMNENGLGRLFVLLAHSGRSVTAGRSVRNSAILICSILLQLAPLLYFFWFLLTSPLVEPRFFEKCPEISPKAYDKLLEEAVHRERILQVFPRESAHTGAYDQDRALEHATTAAVVAADAARRKRSNTETVELAGASRRRVD